jgi:hypothetical protein
MWTVESKSALTVIKFIFWIISIFSINSVLIFWSTNLTNICVEDAMLFLGSRNCILNNILDELIFIQRDATIYSLFIAANCSIYFGQQRYPSSGAEGGSNSDTTTSTRCCECSCMCSWWWVASLIIIQRDATIYILFIAANGSIYFGQQRYPSSGAEGSSSSYTTTSTRCCECSFMCSWWWVASLPEICKAICSNK